MSRTTDPQFAMKCNLGNEYYAVDSLESVDAVIRMLSKRIAAIPTGSHVDYVASYRIDIDRLLDRRAWLMLVAETGGTLDGAVC